MDSSTNNIMSPISESSTSSVEESRRVQLLLSDPWSEDEDIYTFDDGEPI